MIDMVVNQRPFGACDRILDRLQLLRDLDTGTLLFDHADDSAQMSCRPVEPLDDRWVAGVRLMNHAFLKPPPRRFVEYPHGGIDSYPKGG